MEIMMNTIGNKKIKLEMEDLPTNTTKLVDLNLSFSVFCVDHSASLYSKTLKIFPQYIMVN